MKISHEDLMKAVYTAQEMHIPMIHHYIGGKVRIQKWDDHQFLSSSFTTNTIKRITMLPAWKVRSLLKKLTDQGVIEHLRHSPGEYLRFRLPRAECDKIAARQRERWIACGYSDDEVRPRDQDREREVFSVPST